MNISADFPLILTLLVLISGIIALIDLLFFSKKRKISGKKMPWYVDYARSFFPVLLLVWVIRSFVIQPYRVPTGSLEPTVIPGDFIAVTQYSYGLRLPVLNKKIMDVGEPKTGQIALFRWPVDPDFTFVKRVIGTPGDHVVYKDKVLYINGKEATQSFLGWGYDEEAHRRVKIFQENLDGVVHKIYVQANAHEDL